METLKTILKSRTFWGAIIYAIAQYLMTQGILANDLSQAISAIGVGLGLWGARNAEPKV